MGLGMVFRDVGWFGHWGLLLYCKACGVWGVGVLGSRAFGLFRV